MNNKVIKLSIPLLVAIVAVWSLIWLFGEPIRAAESLEQLQTVSIVAVFSEEEIRPVLDEFTVRTGTATIFTTTDNMSDYLLSCTELLNCPDVALIPTPGLVGSLVGQGVLQPLVVPDFDTYFISAWRRLGSVEGALYAAPYAAAHKSMVWYRPEAFDAIGATEPATWQELLSLADQLLADGQTPFSIGAESGGASGWPLSDIFENILLRVGGPETHRRLVDHIIPWTDPLVVQTMERFVDIVGPAGYLAGDITGTLTTSFIDAVDLVFGASPSAAMYFGASFTQFLIDPGLTPFVDYDFFDFPEIRTQFGQPLMGAADFIVSFSSDAEAVSLVDFLVGPDAGEIMVSNNAGRISPNRNVDLNAYMSDVDRAAAELLVNADDFLFDLDDQLPHELQSYVWSALMDFVANQGQMMDILQGLENKATEYQGPSAVRGTLTAGIGSDVPFLDPARLFDSTSFMVTGQIYDTLVDYGPDGFRPVPGLAESWSLSPGGLTWTFQIRPGVQFHDGTDLDAAAVEYNFQRWWDPAHPFHTGDYDYFEYLFGGYKGNPGSLISDTNTIGADQFQLILSRPVGHLPSILTNPVLAIASPAAIQAEILQQEPVGSGPFSFVESLPGDRITLAANPDYWGAGPQLDALIFQIIPDDVDRFAALQSDLIQTAGQLPSNYASLAGSDPNLQVLWHSPMNIGYLGFNRAHAPMGELKVRQAIAHAIDKQALIDASYTEGDLVATDLLPPDIWGSDPALVDYEYNPSLALALLDQAGYPDGFTTTLSIRDVYRAYLPNPITTTSLIQGYLAAVGIDAEIVVYESSEFIGKWLNGELDLYLVGWAADYPHPSNFYHALLCDPGNLGYGPMDTTLCDQLEAAFEETEFSAQLAIYQWASGRIHDTLPLSPIGHGQGPFITRYDVAGTRFTPYHGVDFANVHYVPSTISGNAFLQGRADHSGIAITAWYGGAPANATTTPFSGTYALDVPTATYTVTFDMPRYLDAVISGVTVAAGEIVLLPDQTLRCGDSNDDDIVNILDMALMGSHFHLICADVDWDERADLNADCIVNILDLSCGAGNYLEESDVP